MKFSLQVRATRDNPRTTNVPVEVDPEATAEAVVGVAADTEPIPVDMEALLGDVAAPTPADTVLISRICCNAIRRMMETSSHSSEFCGDG